MAWGITSDTGPSEDAPGNAQRSFWLYINLLLIDFFVCEYEGLTTSYEQNPNLDQYRLNDSDWSLLIDMNAYLDILRRFNIEVDVESCESGSRLFRAVKNLEGQLRFFQKQKPHLESCAFSLLRGFFKGGLGGSLSTHIMGNRSISVKTLYVAHFVDSPSSCHQTHVCVPTLYGQRDILSYREAEERCHWSSEWCAYRS